jgi:hypothetical protein
VKVWSEWQDLNLRPLRPERSAYFLTYCKIKDWQLVSPCFVHAQINQFIAISLRRSHPDLFPEVLFEILFRFGEAAFGKVLRSAAIQNNAVSMALLSFVRP